MTPAQRGRYLGSTTLVANAQFIAEWNLNRASGGPVATNHLLSTQIDDPYFDIEQVALADRPPKGIVKAFSSGSGYPGAGRTTALSSELNAGYSSYVADRDDYYKYWLSPARSGGSLVGGGYPLNNAGIQITYPKALPCNSFVIAFETSISTPKRVVLSWRAGGSWTDQAFTDPIIDSDGRMRVWRQADGSFSQNKYISTNALAIDGVRIEISHLTAPSVYGAVIEVSPRLTVDVTDYVIDSSYSSEMSEASKVAPLGVASANTADITLDNSDRHFSDGNINSPFYGLIGSGINLSMYVSPTAHDESPVASDQVTIFENMSTSEPSATDSTVDLTLKDPARVLQDRNPPGILIQGGSVTEAVLRVCHSVGFNDINYDFDDIDPADLHSVIPFFWTDPDETAWENISRIAEATQTAVYFDEYGKLQIQTRRGAFNSSRPVSWTFDGSDVTQKMVNDNFRPSDELGKFADIVSLDPGADEPPNKAVVNYYETAPGKVNRGVPEMVIAWEPDGDVVLRSAGITADFLTTSPTVSFAPADATVWPYNGMFQVNGEVIEYDAKQYSYYLANGSKATAWVSNHEEKTEYDLKNPGMAWNNTYTGRMRIKERGKYSTAVRNHYSGVPSYLVRRRIGTGTVTTMPSLMYRNTTGGYVRLASASTNSMAYVVAKRTSPYVPRMYGTSIRFQGSGSGGVTIGNGSSDSGIYIELSVSNPLTTAYHELSVYWKNTSGVIKRFGPDGGKGVPITVARDTWYDIDVECYTPGSTHVITVFINGDPKLSMAIPRSESISALPPEQGMYYRGTSSAEFAYFYYLDTIGNSPMFVDNPSIYDSAKGGYRSMVFDTLATWGPQIHYATSDWVTTGALASQVQDYGSKLFLDEIGMIAHEVREFETPFEEPPMMHATPYISNSSQIACPSFRSTPYKANFILVNKARHHAVANGEDTITYGEDNSVEHRMFVYGRQVQVAESKTVDSVNRQRQILDGTVELTIDSRLVQTKTHAENLASWITQASGGGENSVDTSVFANPHIQVGDVVAVNYERHDMNEIHSRFFVVGKRVTYDGGLQLDLTLRSLL